LARLEEKGGEGEGGKRNLRWVVPETEKEGGGRGGKGRLARRSVRLTGKKGGKQIQKFRGVVSGPPRKEGEGSVRETSVCPPREGRRKEGNVGHLRNDGSMILLRRRKKGGRR